jgi:hypothetical protein
MSSIGISLDELLTEMTKLAGESPDGFTVKEMGVHYGRHVQWCRDQLQILVGSRRVICSGRRRITRIDGGVGWVPIYRFISEEKE